MTVVTRIGYIACRILRNNATGCVAAVFERSAYIDVAGQLICLISPKLDDGPLTVTCQDLDTLHIGMRCAPEIGNARVWQPPKPYGWTAGSLADGLTALRCAVVGRVPSAGLGAFVSNKALGPEGTRAGLPVRRLGIWLADAFVGKQNPVPLETEALVGLGPGLTPSGDDFLGGAMVAAHAVGRADIAARLYEFIEANDVGAISAAHLAVASEGAAGEPLHLLLNDVLCGRGETLPARLTALDRMGHTSGWDTLAGAVMVFRAAAGATAAMRAA